MKYQEIPTNISGIYKINFLNGKIYIGRAKNIKYRIWEHYSKNDNTPCHLALKKYYKSYKEIDIDILEKLEEYNYDKICLLEKEYIKKYKSTDKNIGYNITSGGDGGGDGIANPASKITEEDLQNIISLLKENKTNVYIASIYNISPDTVGNINNGKHYYNKDIKYPIRKEPGKTPYLKKCNAFSKEQLDLALYLLENTNMTNLEISNKTNISTSILCKLNTGTHPYCKEYNVIFPIRKSKRTIPLSAEEIKLIKEELLDKNLSTTEIARHFNCSRDTISDIN